MNENGMTTTAGWLAGSKARFSELIRSVEFSDPWMKTFYLKQVTLALEHITFSPPTWCVRRDCAVCAVCVCDGKFSALGGSCMDKSKIRFTFSAFSRAHAITLFIRCRHSMRCAVDTIPSATHCTIEREIGHRWQREKSSELHTKIDEKERSKCFWLVRVRIRVVPSTKQTNIVCTRIHDVCKFETCYAICNALVNRTLLFSNSQKPKKKRKKCFAETPRDRDEAREHGDTMVQRFVSALQKSRHSRRRRRQAATDNTANRTIYFSSRNCFHFAMSRLFLSLFLVARRSHSCFMHVFVSKCVNFKITNDSSRLCVRATLLGTDLFLFPRMSCALCVPHPVCIVSLALFSRTIH